MNEILVVVDSSQTSSQIISFAVDLAKKMNSYITIAWVNDYNNKDVAKSIINDKFDNIVESFSEILDSVFFELRIVPQNSSIELLKLITILEVDIVLIKKYNAKSTFNKIFNDYPLQIQAQVECPIMIFPIDYIYSKSLKSIILPIDLNKNTQQKNIIATIISKKNGAKVQAVFFIDSKNKEGSLEQKKQCIEYMSKHKLLVEYIDINSSLNMEYIINVDNGCNSSIIIIMKDNITDSIFKKYTFTQKLIIESNLPVLSVPNYKSK